MQVTSSIEAVPVLEDIVEPPGHHRRNRHEPRMCAVCAQPLAAQEGACWHCGTPVPEPRRAVSAARRTAVGPPILRALPRPVAAVDGTTPLWTRHTLGAIEAGRDGRLARRAYAPVRYRMAPPAATVVVQADFSADRWADEGGSFDREAAAAVRVAIPRR
jgi:hypothetical protein